MRISGLENRNPNYFYKSNILLFLLLLLIFLLSNYLNLITTSIKLKSPEPSFGAKLSLQFSSVVRSLTAAAGAPRTCRISVVPSSLRPTTLPLHRAPAVSLPSRRLRDRFLVAVIFSGSVALSFTRYVIV